MRALMGFEELMVAPYTQPEGLNALLDRLTDLTVAAIEQWASIGGVDGYMTWEDWGLQTSLQMKVETFREFYKPRYARIVETAHSHGMHYFWHNCGHILDMIPDMIEIGVDVVQLDQPRLMGHHALTQLFGGRICFWNTVDIQWSTRGGVTVDEVRAEVSDMVASFDRFDGGFIARQYPQPWDIDLSYEHNIAIYEAFMGNGCGV
jgi:uroporphyrinogen-III decarboxylase